MTKKCLSDILVEFRTNLSNVKPVYKTGKVAKVLEEILENPLIKGARKSAITKSRPILSSKISQKNIEG